jgi:hypothetical protein
MTNTPTPSELSMLTHRGTCLNVLFRGWLKSSGVNFKTPAPVKGIDAKTGINKANKGFVLVASHKHNHQRSNYLWVQMQSTSLITVIMLSRNVNSSHFEANKPLFNIINTI